MKPSVKILVEARALLARRGGWVRGALYQQRIGSEASYCSMGALNKVAVGFAVTYQAPERRGFKTAERALAQAMGPYRHMLPSDAIIRFNDRSKTRKKDVLAAFDRAIEALS